LNFIIIQVMEVWLSPSLGFDSEQANARNYGQERASSAAAGTHAHDAHK
jgi:hypothetical protein